MNNKLCTVSDVPCRASESNPLLLPSSRDELSYSKCSCQLLEHTCLPSKAAIVLICLAAVVGAMHTIFACVFAFGAVIVASQYIPESATVTISYLAMTITVVLYPVSGFFADVVYGRYKVMIFSMCLIVVSFILYFGAATLVVVSSTSFPLSLSYANTIVIILLIVLFGLTFAMGYISYYANYIPFGLDQLMEAPSGQLSLFVHWIVWADSLISAVIIPVTALIFCHKQHTVTLTFGVHVVCLISLIVLLVFICCKHRWFRREPGLQNPYKTVIKVLNFARKHTRPLQRSAFTYCDDERPSRLDFCKDKYGGPFTTEQVEDVKTFTRILFILIAIAPVFVFDVSSSLYGLPLIGVHIAHKGREYCSVSWILLESGALRNIVSAVIFPIYIWFIFYFMRKRAPNMFTRLKIGISLYLIGVLSILLADVVGHSHEKLQSHNSTQCVFAVQFDEQNFGLKIPLLRVHWASLIPADLFLGIGPILVFTTALEFISAQSPHSMKGLIVGLFITVKGLFQLLGSLALLPFSLKVIWGSEYMREHPPVTNCGFGYLLFTCVVALLGLILFSIVAKRYKYRQRDDRPYDQRFVVDVYDRYLKPANDSGPSYDSVSD